MSADNGPTRGRPSRFDTLPPEIRAYVDRRLREGATQASVRRETAGMLADADEAPLSAGGLNRYTQKIERAGRRIRESRAAADAWVARFGEAPSGNVGRLVIETLRTLVHDLTLRLERDADGDEPVSVAAINDLALAMQRIERADELSVARERRLRAEMREQMAAEAETVARAADISDDTAAALREALTTLPMAA